MRRLVFIYGPGSGREIEPDYPNANVDINPKIDEFRIVGPVSGTVGINSIKAGDGVTATTVIDVKLSEGIQGLNTDTNVIINNVTDTRYNGTFLVTEITDTDVNGTTGFKYEVPVAPGDVHYLIQQDQISNFLQILSHLRLHMSLMYH